MTKEEIIKGLNLCKSSDPHDCKDCPYRSRGEVEDRYVGCCNKLITDALDLIRKQDIEIECYKIANTHMHSSIIGTVKEFAELIKGIVEFDISLSESETEYLLIRIDEALNEFLEGIT